MSKRKKTRGCGPVGRFFLRLLLVVVTLAILLAGGLAWMLNTIFTGPSETARNELTVFLAENPATKWIPGLFLEDELVEEICGEEGALSALPMDGSAGKEG